MGPDDLAVGADTATRHRKLARGLTLPWAEGTRARTTSAVALTHANHLLPQARCRHSLSVAPASAFGGSLSRQSDIDPIPKVIHRKRYLRCADIDRKFALALLRHGRCKRIYAGRPEPIRM